MGVVTPKLGLEVLQSCIEKPNELPPVIMVSPIEWMTFQKHIPKWQTSMCSKFLVDNQVQEESEFTKILKQLSVEERKIQVNAELNKIVSNLVGDEIDQDIPLMESGIDSLSSVELKNAVQSKFALTLSATFLFDYPNLNKMTEYISAIYQ